MDYLSIVKIRPRTIYFFYTSCNTRYSPPVYVCRNCKSENLESAEISVKGKLYTYSTVHVPTSILENEAPYTLVIVELRDGCKVTGRLMGSHSKKLEIGASVELKEIREGVYLFGLVGDKKHRR